MKKLINTLICFILTLLISSTNLAQDKNIISQFLRIKLFESDRNDLKDLYGIGTYWGSKYVVLYDTDFGTILITYSSGLCKTQKIKTWNLPEWTVTDISYSINDDSIKIKPLLKQIEPYQSKGKGDSEGIITYYNSNRGIYIVYDANSDSVEDIHFKPTKNQIKKHSCAALNMKK